MQSYRKDLRSLLDIHRPAQVGIQVCAFLLATLMAFLLRFDFNIPPVNLKHLFFGLYAFGIAKLIVFVVMGLYRGWWRYVSM